MNFIGESDALKHVNTPGHPNVLKLYGCCLQQYPLLIVTEHCEKGDLKTVLVNHRKPTSAISTGSHIDINSQMLCRFAADIAAGMAYLSEMHWVHRGGYIIVCYHPV